LGPRIPVRGPFLCVEIPSRDPSLAREDFNMRHLIALALIVLVGCASAGAQPASPFAPFQGSWRGEGRFQGAPSDVDATFAPLFGGAAWSLDVDIRFTPPNAPAAQRFRGRAGYAMRNGALTGGSWVDSGGNGYALTPRFEDGALIVGWGAGQVNGRSEYRIETDGDLAIIDSIETPQGWRQFATAELRRAS